MPTKTKAPIALFVYNRPVHTSKTLDALKSNKEAIESDLFIFCDGPKSGDLENIASIQKVRDIIQNVSGFKSIKVFEHEINLGLSKSIIWGVNKIFESNESIIVIEDDIQTSPFFLNFMNDALKLYENESFVGCINGWNFPLELDEDTPETFFLPGADCWGWATWKRAWNLFELDGVKLKKNVVENNLEYFFNRRGQEDLFNILENQINKNNDSWAIRWYATLFCRGMYCLYPKNSFVLNSGFDGTGTHCKEISIEQSVQNSYKTITKVKVEDSDWFYPKLELYQKNRIAKLPKPTLIIRIKSILYLIFKYLKLI